MIRRTVMESPAGRWGKPELQQAVRALPGAGQIEILTRERARDVFQPKRTMKEDDS